MYPINVQAVEFVKGEIQSEFDQLTANLSVTSEDLEFSKLSDQFTRLRGIFSLLEMPGAESLVSEAAASLDFSAQRGLTEAQITQVKNLAKFLPGYVQHIQNRKADNPLLVIDQINEFRSWRDELPVDEYTFLAPLMPKNLLVTDVSPLGDDVLKSARLARQMLQKGLANTIRGTGLQSAIKIMSQAAMRLEKLVSQEEEKHYWKVAQESLHGLVDGSLVLDKTRVSMLIQVEQQIKQLLQGAAVDKSYPASLQKQMMATFALTGITTEGAQQLSEKLGIKAPAFTARFVDASRASFSVEKKESMQDTMLQLGESYGELKLMFDECSVQAAISEEDAEKLKDNFAKTAEYCDEAGLTKAAERCRSHAETMTGFANAAFSQQMGNDFANTLLYLDSVMVEINNNAPTEQRLASINERDIEEIVELNIVSSAERHALQELMGKLTESMQIMTDFFEGMDNAQSKSTLVNNLHDLVNSLAVLGLERAGQVSKRCGNVVDKALSDDSGEAAKTLSDDLADAMVSLEYYLDNRRWNNEFDDSVLSVAESCLTMLEEK